MSYEIISREAAFALGRKRFYTGRPCKYGHDAQRYTSTGNCVACNLARAQAFASKADRAGGRFFYDLHPDDHAAALAYCQALDMARGRTPTAAPPAPAAPAASAPFDVLKARELALGRAAALHGLPPAATYLGAELDGSVN